MVKFLLALALFVLAPAAALADGLCAAIPITTLPPAPLMNANLQCDTAGNLKVNVVTGGGGGTITLPYTYTFNQSPAAASFLGIGGFDGTNFQPVAVNSSGQLSVTGSFYQAVQPVSITVASTPIPVVFPTGSPIPVAIATGSPIPITGTVNANITNTPVPTFTPAPAYSMQPAQPVIAQPPNGSTFPVSQTTTSVTSGTLSSTGSVTAANTTAAQGAYVVTTSASFVGTYIYQGTDAAGATHTLTTIPGGSRPNNYDTSETAAQSVYLDVTGMTSVSVTVTAFTGGSLTAYIQLTPNVPAMSGGWTNGSASYRGSIPITNLCQGSGGNVTACATINANAAGGTIGTTNSQLNVAAQNYGYQGTGWIPQPACNQYATVTVNAAGSSPLINPSASYPTRVCAFMIETQTASTTFQLGFAAAATGCTSAPTATISFVGGADQVFSSPAGPYTIFQTPTNYYVCINVAGSSPVVSGYVIFSQ